LNKKMTINDPKRQMSNDGTVVSNVSNDSGGDSAQLNNIWYFMHFIEAILSMISLYVLMTCLAQKLDQN
jgi:hypothetical protein